VGCLCRRCILNMLAAKLGAGDWLDCIPPAALDASPAVRMPRAARMLYTSTADMCLGVPTFGRQHLSMALLNDIMSLGRLVEELLSIEATWDERRFQLVTRSHAWRLTDEALRSRCICTYLLVHLLEMLQPNVVFAEGVVVGGVEYTIHMGNSASLRDLALTRFVDEVRAHVTAATAAAHCRTNPASGAPLIAGMRSTASCTYPHGCSPCLCAQANERSTPLFQLLHYTSPESFMRAVRRGVRLAQPTH
jgi:hypothetical protein